MVGTLDLDSRLVNNERKYRSPNRVLARSFRLARDKWKNKYMDTRAELKRARKLASERDASRNQWRVDCEAAIAQARAAEALAEQRLQELEELRERVAELKKTWLANAS